MTKNIFGSDNGGFFLELMCVELSPDFSTTYSLQNLTLKQMVNLQCEPIKITHTHTRTNTHTHTRIHRNTNKHTHTHTD